MREHVVHLAGDPGPLLAAGLGDPQLLLGLGPRGAWRSVQSSSRREPMYMPQPIIAAVTTTLMTTETQTGSWRSNGV